MTGKPAQLDAAGLIPGALFACSDKTGTLTTNEMVVRAINTVGAFPSETNTYEVGGTSYLVMISVSKT